MQKNHYASPVEAIANHCNHCPVCIENQFGLCAAGFRLLREASNLTDNQPELFPREIQDKLRLPLVRTFLHRR